MPSAKKLKRALIAGFGGLALVTAFNAAAAPMPAAPTHTQTTTVTPPANQNTPAQPAPVTDPAQEQLNKQMAGALFAMGQKIESREKTDPTYDATRDPELVRDMDAIKDLLAAGADPNYYPKDGIDLLGATNLNMFEAAIVLSGSTGTSDLVDAFLAHGADVKFKASDNWSPMDYAISELMEAQAISTARIHSAVAIIQKLRAHGAELADAKEVLEGTTVTGFKDLARNLVGLATLRDAGLITQEEYQKVAHGNPKAVQKIRSTRSITEEFLKQNGATIQSLPDLIPGGPEPYTVQDGDTLASLAQRFAVMMGAKDEMEARDMIANRNGIRYFGSEHRAQLKMRAGVEILIPVPADRQIGVIRAAQDGATLEQLSKAVGPVYYRKGATPQQILDDLVRINGIGATDPLKKDQAVMVPLINDSYGHLPALTPPAKSDNREVDLIVIEGHRDGETHDRDTYRVTTGTAYSINPKVDFRNFHSMAEMLLGYPAPKNSDTLHMLLNATGSRVQDRVVFSHSMAWTKKAVAADIDRNKRGADSPEYESIRMQLGRMDQSRPIIFDASGNFWPEEGRYIPSYNTVHSPRTVLIGAVGSYRTGSMFGPMARTISPYTTYGADVCAPLPRNLNNQMEGTSFATPLTASLYRQMSEWYGDRLSFEEIMAAGMMSADRDVLDYVNPGQVTGDEPRTNNTFQTQMAQYITNGGGLPRHERCGAGVINVERWNETLKTMVDLKAGLRRPASDSTTSVNAGTPEIRTDANGKTEYVYRMRVPSDMTLGKLTFLLPQYQGRHSEMVVRTPAGFEMHMPRSYSDVISTFAFAYEDVKAGDIIEIRTGEPLGPTAGIMLRGHAPGNAIAALRDHLRQQGVMPAPLKTMSGNNVTGDAQPINLPRPEEPKQELPPVTPAQHTEQRRMPRPQI